MSCRYKSVGTLIYQASTLSGAAGQQAGKFGTAVVFHGRDLKEPPARRTNWHGRAVGNGRCLEVVLYKRFSTRVLQHWRGEHARAKRHTPLDVIHMLSSSPVLQHLFRHQAFALACLHYSTVGACGCNSHISQTTYPFTVDSPHPLSPAVLASCTAPSSLLP